MSKLDGHQLIVKLYSTLYLPDRDMDPAPGVGA